jgi:hypothetical protein
MTNRIGKVLVLAMLLGAAALPLMAQGRPATAGPPQFVTFPILMHVGEDGLDHGHFIFTEGAAIPGPLAHDAGSAAYVPATSGTLAISAGADLNVSNSPSSYEGETGVAATATLMVGGSNHIFPGACSSTNVCAPDAYASSNGTTWTHTVLPLSWNNATLGIGFDPGVDFDKNGVFYFSYGVAPLSANYPNGIVMVKSTNGTTWTKLTPVTFNKNRFFDDKYYLAIDRSTSPFGNRIYVSWDRNSGNNQILYLAYSSNSGSTWSAPVKVNDGTTGFERVIGAYPAVAQQTAGGVAAGTVFDSWHDYAKNKIFVDKSTNGGVSWGTDVAAATTHAGFGQDIGCVGGRSQGPAHAIKVGPSGTIYLVYADPVAGRGFDILFTKSTNGGATWSTPVTVNDDAGAADQFHPTLSVESNGAGGDKVTISFYDRREDSSNCLAHVFATQSTDNGATFSANTKVTSAPSNFNGNPNGPGDYSSSHPFAGGVFPLFSDHRASDYEVYTGKIQ